MKNCIFPVELDPDPGTATFRHRSIQKLKQRDDVAPKDVGRWRHGKNSFQRILVLRAHRYNDTNHDIILSRFLRSTHQRMCPLICKYSSMPHQMAFQDDLCINGPWRSNRGSGLSRVATLFMKMRPGPKIEPPGRSRRYDLISSLARCTPPSPTREIIIDQFQKRDYFENVKAFSGAIAPSPGQR